MYQITKVRTEPSPDGSHLHIGLVGYSSAHIVEVITVPPARVLQQIALGESFSLDLNGEKADVSAGACEVCGFEPYLKTSADTPGDNKILSLPSA